MLLHTRNTRKVSGSAAASRRRVPALAAALPGKATRFSDGRGSATQGCRHGQIGLASFPDPARTCRSRGCPSDGLPIPLSANHLRLPKSSDPEKRVRQISSPAIGDPLHRRSAVHRWRVDPLPLRTAHRRPLAHDILRSLFAPHAGLRCKTPSATVPGSRDDRFPRSQRVDIRVGVMRKNRRSASRSTTSAAIRFMQCGTPRHGRASTCRRHGCRSRYGPRIVVSSTFQA